MRQLSCFACNYKFSTSVHTRVWERRHAAREREVELQIGRNLIREYRGS